MKELKNLLSKAIRELNRAIEIDIAKSCIGIFDANEALQKEMLASLSGNQQASKRARVKSVELTKMLKEYRRLSVLSLNERKNKKR